MLDPLLRETKTVALAPLARAMRRVAPALGPDAVTAGGLAVGLAAAAAASMGAWPAALAGWWINRLLDGLDGELARLSDDAGLRRDLGGVRDLFADQVTYLALPLAVAAATGAWPAAAAFLAACYLNVGTLMHVAALAEKRGAPPLARRRVERGAHGGTTSVPFAGGLFEGAETLVLYTLLLAFPHAATLWLSVGAALVAATALQRLALAGRVVRARNA